MRDLLPEEAAGFDRLFAVVMARARRYGYPRIVTPIAEDREVFLRTSGQASDTWQLHANGWRFAAGHVAKLELLGADAPYARPSNGSFKVTVQSLELRLPVREQPGGQVQPALAPVIPAGQQAVLGERKASRKTRAHARKHRAHRRKTRRHHRSAQARARNPRFTG
jgi:hypothetical protein